MLKLIGKTIVVFITILVLVFGISAILEPSEKDKQMRETTRMLEDATRRIQQGN